MAKAVEFLVSVVSSDGRQIVIALFDGADTIEPCALVRGDVEAVSALKRALAHELRNLRTLDEGGAK